MTTPVVFMTSTSADAKAAGNPANPLVVSQSDGAGGTASALPPGRAPAAASVPTVMSTEDLAAVLPGKTTTNRSIATSTTAANAMALNAARRGWKVKNDSAIDVWINFTGTATAVAGSGNMKILAGGYLASEPGYVETGAMSIIAASGTPAITIYEFS